VTTIEAFADIWCPFAHVGLRIVVARRDQLGRDASALRVRAWPLELVNGSPLDPAQTAHHVAELRSQCAPDLFSGFDPAEFPVTSLPALALAAAAYRRGDHVGEAVSLALRNALFEEGRDISEPPVLREIADAHGLEAATVGDEAAVRADWLAGQARGVQGSPHFFCGETNVFCPSLDISRDDVGHLRIHPDPAALNAFLTDCLTP
jgi:predicted DsbA family dithiol-disulfide isomerase